MPNKNKLMLCIAGLLACFGSATAQETFDPALLQKVESDHLAMMEMTNEERRAYWQVNVNDLERSDRLTYQRAYKSLVPSLPRLPNNAGPATRAASATESISTVRVPGTNITYDNGIPTGVTFPTPSVSVGNLFNTGANAAGTGIENVETSGSITMVTVNMLAVGGGAAFFSVFSNIMGTSANLVSSMTIPVTTGLNTVTLTAALNYANGPFLAGMWNFTAASDSAAVSTGTVNGQGFHGISINDIAGTGLNTGITSAGMGLNGILRVSGDVLQDTVPVELIDFTIED